MTFKLIRLDELMVPDDGRPARTRWGNWQFHPHNLTLRYEPLRYEVDLEKITSSARMLDWIFQIAPKNWATPKVRSDLLDALEALLQPQGNYCGAGRDVRPDPRAILRGRRTR